MKHKSGVIAVPDVAKNAAGAVTWWQLSGTISESRLREALVDADYTADDLPALPSDQVALRRALVAYASTEPAENGRLMVRPLEAGSYAVVRETIVKEQGERSANVVYSTLFRAWVDSDTAVVDLVDSVDTSLDDVIDILYARSKTTYEGNDLSAWFCRRIEELRSISLRERGGIYYVPEQFIGEWRRFSTMIQGCSSCVIYEIPAVRSDRAIAAILDALTREAETFADNVGQQIDGGNLGTVALENRKNRCDELAAKLGTYEELLGTKLTQLREVCEQVRGRAVQAILAAEQEAA